MAFVPWLSVFSSTPVTPRIYNILLKSLHDDVVPSRSRMRGKCVVL